MAKRAEKPKKKKLKCIEFFFFLIQLFEIQYKLNISNNRGVYTGGGGFRGQNPPKCLIVPPFSSDLLYLIGNKN